MNLYGLNSRSSLHFLLYLFAKTCTLDSGSGINTTLVIPGTVSTQLFASKPASGWIESFLAPAVEPHDLAMSIIAQLEMDESGDVYLPVYSRWTWLLRGLPDWLRDVLSRSTSMATIQEWNAKEK